MKVLLITSKEEDYLQDSIIHGFKQLLGRDAIDYPAKNILYNDYRNVNSLRGNGFTLYGLLDSNLKITKELNIEAEICDNKFDLIVFTSIYRQYEVFYRYFELLKKQAKKVWVIDGEDTPLVFPYLPKHLKKYMFSPKPHNHFVYFKRELHTQGSKSLYLKFSEIASEKIVHSNELKSISFSIPQSKIINFIPVKTKLFPRHIVDEEFANKISSGDTRYIFNNEKDYYLDLQQSKFGITTRRAGWDCMRHYEIAANASVICFKNLDQKPALCAPHGLISEKNCLSYSDYDDLMDKINNLSENKYEALLNSSLQWIKNNTTTQRVRCLLQNQKAL